MNRIESQLLPSAPVQTDGMLRRAVLGTIVGYLLSGAPNPADGYLRRWSHADATTIEAPAPPSFPTQFLGLRAYFHAAVQDLCLVAEADAPSGMGGVIKIDKNGTLYAVYLVDTTDPDATPIRVETTTGVKAIRAKT